MTAEPRQPKAHELLAKLAQRIRSARERQGLTQEQFASRCGISVSFASLLERGERSPSYQTLVQVAEALEMSVSELFRDVGTHTSDEPHLGKLVEFARGARLSRLQVERLIAVAAAMFEVSERRPAAPQARPEGGACSVAGCGRALLAKGLCASHYHRARRAGALSASSRARS